MEAGGQRAGVLDCGGGVVKAGFAGDDEPAAAYEAVVGRPKYPRALAGGALEGDLYVVVAALRGASGVPMPITTLVPTPPLLQVCGRQGRAAPRRAAAVTTRVTRRGGRVGGCRPPVAPRIQHAAGGPHRAGGAYG